MTEIAGAGAGDVGEASVGDAEVNGRFDASQYAFFGKDVLEEVELGGFEDDDDGNNVDLIGLEEEEGGLSEIDNLASTFAKVNKVVGDPQNTLAIGDRGSFSRESSSTLDWTLESDLSFQDHHILDAEYAKHKQWWSQPHRAVDRLADSQSLYRTSSSPQDQHHQYGSTESIRHFSESKSLYRTSSYPQEQEQQHGFSDLPLLQNSFPSVPPPGGPFHISPNHLRFSERPSASGPHMPLAAPNFRHLPGSQLHLAGSHGLPYRGNVPQIQPQGLNDSWQQNHWMNQADSFMANNLPPNMHQQSPITSGLMPPLQQPGPRFSQFHPHLLNPYPPQMMNNFENNVRGMADFRDQRFGSIQRDRQTPRFPQSGIGISSKRHENGWPQFRSKYMSAEEIENILRMQHVATHINEPYIDDYYHQACLAKRSGGSTSKYHFCPSSFRDLSSRTRSDSEPHAYLQIDALGRVPFSSVRRPRPLLEVEPPASSGETLIDQISFVKPLEQEPMLAARITIEDGICLLLDVDDIDRLSKFSQLPDGGSQLKQKRHALLEGLATSLHLVDPLGSRKSDHSAGLGPNDDLVFLRLVSLPKGQKLLSRYLQRLPPGSELTRIVCMAIFRHLRFLFGTLPSDSDGLQITNNLTRTVCSRIHGMDLSALSACLAAIVCSQDQPPLRPLGSSAGDAASVIIKSVLERATDILTDQSTASNYSTTNRALWQASFDAFFNLLTRYCLRKYESITQSQAPATQVISMEMPVELLRASLPHTDEHQRQMLRDFARRSLPVSGNSHGNGSESIVS